MKAEIADRLLSSRKDQYIILHVESDTHPLFVGKYSNYIPVERGENVIIQLNPALDIQQFNQSRGKVKGAIPTKEEIDIYGRLHCIATSEFNVGAYSLLTTLKEILDEQEIKSEK